MILSRQIRLKVYGTIKIQKRENWKHKYRLVTRDDDGKLKTWRKWTPTTPRTKREIVQLLEKWNVKIYDKVNAKKGTVYIEKYVETKTGKEARKEVAKAIDKEKWIKKPIVES